MAAMAASTGAASLKAREDVCPALSGVSFEAVPTAPAPHLRMRDVNEMALPRRAASAAPTKTAYATIRTASLRALSLPFRLRVAHQRTNSWNFGVSAPSLRTSWATLKLPPGFISMA